MKIKGANGLIFEVPDSVASGLIGSGAADTVVVVGVETLSRIVDYTDRNTCVLFGDGAGAAVLQACEPGLGIHAVEMHSDGELGEVLPHLPGRVILPDSLREALLARDPHHHPYPLAILREFYAEL